MSHETIATLTMIELETWMCMFRLPNLDFDILILHSCSLLVEISTLESKTRI